jgi:AcrR family transcriptional regulator
MTAKFVHRRRLAQPKQARSRNSHERLVKAIEDLLAVHEFNTITVEQIAVRAHLSVGTFYKHFASKRDLLPLLLDRLRAHGGTYDFKGHSSRRVGVSLAARVSFLVQLVASMATLRRNVLRACVAARFTNELVLSGSQVDQAREQLRSAQEWLLECRGEITHDDPVMAVRVGFYSTLQSLQTALLFENLPEDLPIGTLVSETGRLLTAYLTCAGNVSTRN